jgi:hypothetical protein
MATSRVTYHEPLNKLSTTTRDMHRVLVSLQEDLEAVDWYQQRADACEDDDLKAILLHNMREEIERAASARLASCGITKHCCSVLPAGHRVWGYDIHRATVAERMYGGEV